MILMRYLLCAVCLLAPRASAQGSLQERLNRLVAQSALDKARVGICLLDSANGAVLASRNADEPLTPASNMKLLTSGAAVATLGPGYVFRTTLQLEKSASGDRLIFKGSGDPALADPEVLRRGEPPMRVADVLAAIARAAKQAGVTGVREVVIDDRVFDREYVHPSWNQDNLHLGYSAQVSGLNFHNNVLSLFAKPGAIGAAPSYSLEPVAGFVRIDASRARTITQGSNKIALIREGDTNNFQFRGEVKSASELPANVTLHNPPLFAGELLAEALAGAGVKIEREQSALGESAAHVRLTAADEVFGETQTIAVIATSIDEVLRRCNTDSENLYAECLLKAMGHAESGAPGSWSNGGAALKAHVAAELGSDAAAGVVAADGSGLSRDDKVSPRTLARWLGAMAGKPWAEQFVASLAAPGEGTLEKRFRKQTPAANVRAKSGFINGVRSLSGYVTDAQSGRRLVFVVLVNDLSADGDQHTAAKTLQENIVMLLDETLASQRRDHVETQGGGR